MTLTGRLFRSRHGRWRAPMAKDTGAHRPGGQYRSPRHDGRVERPRRVAQRRSRTRGFHRRLAPHRRKDTGSGSQRCCRRWCLEIIARLSRRQGMRDLERRCGREPLVCPLGIEEVNTAGLVAPAGKASRQDRFSKDAGERLLFARLRLPPPGRALNPSAQESTSSQRPRSIRLLDLLFVDGLAVRAGRQAADLLDVLSRADEGAIEAAPPPRSGWRCQLTGSACRRQHLLQVLDEQAGIVLPA